MRAPRASRREARRCPRRWRPSRAVRAAWLRARAAPSLRRGSANHHAASHPFAETPRCSAPMLRFNPYALWASYARLKTRRSAVCRTVSEGVRVSQVPADLRQPRRHRRAGTSYQAAESQAWKLTHTADLTTRHTPPAPPTHPGRPAARALSPSIDRRRSASPGARRSSPPRRSFPLETGSCARTILLLSSSRRRAFCWFGRRGPVVPYRRRRSATRSTCRRRRRSRRRGRRAAPSVIS